MFECRHLDVNVQFLLYVLETATALLLHVPLIFVCCGVLSKSEAHTVLNCADGKEPIKGTVSKSANILATRKRALHVILGVLFPI